MMIHGFWHLFWLLSEDFLYSEGDYLKLDIILAIISLIWYLELVFLGDGAEK